MAESSEDKFRRLAEARVIRAIKDIRLIGNLSNRSNYSYEKSDVEKIFRALEREIKQTRIKFENDEKQDDIEFSLR